MRGNILTLLWSMHILSAFAEWIGKPDRADTPSFATNPAHLSHLNACVGLISEALTGDKTDTAIKGLGVLACRLVQSTRWVPFLVQIMSNRMGRKLGVLQLPDHALT